ncbi:hypothetical protein V6S67_15090 [Arthrobacter sp. Soc17.1.1.1]|uniref:hypothetical protein n=1 Tax=Arthrobacter sp. Soc17.1.1.1 TaxID=3121277 RepID=UPI002FE4E136
MAPVVSTPDPVLHGSALPVLGFGVAEVAFLLSLAEGEQSARSRDALAIGAELSTAVLTAAGASSLLARGLVRVEDGRISPLAGAEYLAYVLAAAERWTRIGLFNEDAFEFAIYVQAREASVLLQPAALSTWFAVIREPGATDADLLLDVVRTNVAAHPSSAVYLGTSTLDGTADFFVRAAGDDLWDTADVPEPGMQDRDPLVPTARLVEKLAALTALPVVQR